MNSASVNIHVQVFFFFFFPPFGTCLLFPWVLMGGIAELYDNFMFNFLSNCQTLFPCLHHFNSSKQCTNIPISPHSLQCLLFAIHVS